MCIVQDFCVTLQRANLFFFWHLRYVCSVLLFDAAICHILKMTQADLVACSCGILQRSSSFCVQQYVAHSGQLLYV